LLLAEAANQITQSRFTEAFYMYIEVLGKFIAFGQLSPSEKDKLQKSLETFLSYKDDVGGEHRLQIYAGILDILLQFELDDEDYRLKQFISGVT
jgi:hypothetical protein